VLAALALRAGRPATIAELATAVWGDAPPTTPKQQIHSAISGLRYALGDQLVARHARGYQLSAGVGQVDALLFETLITQARMAVADGQLALAVSRWHEALALWRGPALAGLPGLSAQAVRLEEQRMLALEERIAAELQLGRHRDLIPELSQLVAEQPAREQLVGHFMVALTRSGRASEALEIYRQTRRRLVTETGMDVGPELRRLELSVLRGDFERRAGPGPPLQVYEPERNVLAQLPPGLKSLAGRADALAQLAVFTSGGARLANPLAILITGAPGIGKTALAVAWAHRLSDEFPDGQLYADLHGFSADAEAVPPANVLGVFLDALGVPPHRVPSGLPARIGLFRQLLASRRLVVVLDNARDADQVRSLMPGTPGCLTIVSSRDQMPSLIADQAMRFLRLDPLSDRPARDLLASRLGSDRIDAEPEAIDGIVRSCAGLPLALVSVAGRALTHPSFPLRALADELRRPEGRLDMLSCGEQATSVRAAFSVSYRLLGAPAARMFRLLGLHAGPEISVPAAASLVGAGVSRARLLLAELDAANLVTEHRPGRFHQHELLRAYSADLLEQTESPADRRAATVRLLDFYSRGPAAQDEPGSGQADSG
jgi:DNA-binding SARP family transcriptional activator